MASKLTGANHPPNLTHFFQPNNNNNNNCSNNNSGPSLINNSTYKYGTSACHFDKDKEAINSSCISSTNAIAATTTTSTTSNNNNNNNNNNSNNNPSKSSGATTKCAGCRKVIKEKYLLKALDQLWHEDCLKCSCCDCRLGEVGSTLFTKANLLLCRRDYLRLFGTTGYCCACSKMIPAFEMVMKAKNNVYHLECFACQQCNHRFCVGDRYFLCDNKILCEYDYEERLLLAKATFEYAAYAQNLPHVNNPYFGNCNNNNSNNFTLPTSHNYPNENNFGFPTQPFFNPLPPTRGSGPTCNGYTPFPPYPPQPPTPLQGTNLPPPMTRVNNPDDISSGYGSPSPAST